MIMRFFGEYMHHIPGCLVDYAAIRTMGILNCQEQNTIRWPLFEIGVYYWRYLSLVIWSALRLRIAGRTRYFSIRKDQHCERRGSLGSRTPKASLGCRPRRPHFPVARSSKCWVRNLALLASTAHTNATTSFGTFGSRKTYLRHVGSLRSTTFEPGGDGHERRVQNFSLPPEISPLSPIPPTSFSSAGFTRPQNTSKLSWTRSTLIK